MLYAVIAHYDVQDIWEENFLVLLESVRHISDKIAVVSTSTHISDLPSGFSDVILIRRPNIGYDFYSYKVGVLNALSDPSIDSVLLVNSSILVLNKNIFIKTLGRLISMRSKEGFRGVTRSYQFEDHLQSYLLYFDLHTVRRERLFSFFNKVEPLNTKLELILEYEIGLSRFLRSNGYKGVALFCQSFPSSIRGYYHLITSSMQSNVLGILLPLSFYNMLRSINWSHFAAPTIARLLGFVKAEILISNPNNIQVDQIHIAIEGDLKETIDGYVTRKSHFYSLKKSGLTELDIRLDKTGIIREYIGIIPNDVVSRRKIAVVVHLFYLDLFEEILEYLANILEPFDLYVTTPFERDISDIVRLASSRGCSPTILLVKNMGRDIGPFLALYVSGLLDTYDAVLKIHSKKSYYSREGGNWRTRLLESICGTSMIVLKSTSLIRDKRCGIVGPSSFFLTNSKFMGANQRQLHHVLLDCGILDSSSIPDVAFFAGSMFWFCPRALSAIHRCKARSLSFQDENGLQDGTLAHAWERAFCIIASHSGYIVSSPNHAGASIFNDLSNMHNTVPVL